MPYVSTNDAMMRPSIGLKPYVPWTKETYGLSVVSVGGHQLLFLRTRYPSRWKAYVTARDDAADVVILSTNSVYLLCLCMYSSLT